MSFALTLLLVQVGSNSLWLLLFLAALISIVLGMGMPTVGVYVLLAALVAPAMVKIGLSPMASHMFVLYFGMMSMITPPVALAAFAAASLAQTDADEDRLDRGALRLDRLHHPVPVRARAVPAAGRQPAVGHHGRSITSLIGVWFDLRGLCRLRHAGARACRCGSASASPACCCSSRPTPWRTAIWTDIIGLALGAVLLAREIMATRSAAPLGRVPP